MELVFDTLRALFFTDIFGSIDLYTIISTALKYMFVFIVLYFIYMIVRVIFLDVKNVYRDQGISRSYLKLQTENRQVQRASAYYVLDDYNSIGRDLENDLVLDDTLVSRRHAIILRKSDGFYIEDMQSSNGTYLNDRQLFESTKLENQDKIRLGDYNYIFNARDEVFNENQFEKI